MGGDYDQPPRRPDYRRSIVNLIASIAGAQAPAPEHYPPLELLSDTRTEGRPLALLVLDGLGDHFLQRFPDSHLARHRMGRLTSVFPTTTAAAVSALALGVPVQQHAIPAWVTYFRELGGLGLPLPFAPRIGGACFSEQGVKAAHLLGQAPLLPSLERPARAVLPAFISDSAYSQGLYGATPRRPHDGSLDDFFAQVEEPLREPGAPLVWGYWTELDALGHQFGPTSEEVERHFRALDQAFAHCLERLRGSGALLLVTADHGLVDTGPQHRVALEDHPALQEMLVLPLSGEPRAAFCHLRAGAESEFDAYCRERLAEQFWLLDSRRQIETGLFGRGVADRRLASRVGDRILLAREQWVIGDRLLPEGEFLLRGVHGGLSEEELYVPLIRCEL
ncbi:alkaline phosphatase family protein [Motiliproteus sp. SC1-56]|uniref:alkaline phosphatase family protein n=1 Tax=Motiliproteus sp. SC1-56 TaxID=2799565 RepID=UPI001A8C22CD|nr:alkaline phosphatase family protein [Motiliproteus sp. SC1-56]